MTSTVRNLSLVCAIAVSLFASGNGSARATGDMQPEAVIRGIYALYTQKGCPGLPGGETARSRFLAPELAHAFTENDKLLTATGSLDNVVDFNPFIDGQDCKVTGVTITPGRRASDTASVRASFRNFGAAHEITYDLVQTPAGWRVSNVRRLGHYDLRALLKMK